MLAYLIRLLGSRILKLCHAYVLAMTYNCILIVFVTKVNDLHLRMFKKL